MKVLKTSVLNLYDTVTLKTDKATIERLKEWEDFEPDMLGLIYGESTIEAEEDDDEGDDEKVYHLDNGHRYPTFALTLIKEKNKEIKRKKVQFITDESKRTLTFHSNRKVAVLECGEEIKIDDLIAIGELAKEFKIKPKTPAKKAAKKTRKK